MKEMASSDEEGDVVTTSASDYEFMCGRDEPISFAKLPVEWKKDEALDGNRRKIFLSGKTDNGLRKIYKQVMAWKFDLTGERPVIFVLSVDGNWVKLLKPRKAFIDIVRTILVTVHFLHFARRNPEKPQKALWDYLNKEFSILERRPSEEDMVDHMVLINEAAKRDEMLAKSKLLTTFLLEKPRKKKSSYEDVKRPFIVDDNDESEDPEEADKYDGGDDKIDEIGDQDIDEDDCFDSVCAICDNGGHIYLCEGMCMRSFHATVADGEESNCDSLNLTGAELEELKTKDFYCNNCLYKKHQCFSCGELGSSDVTSPEVFKCVNGACGHFYHPRCVAKLLHPGNSLAAEEQRQKIVAGEQFACPVHKCHVCQGLEVRTNEELQFAVCRRCPRAYHRKCMPRDIPFEDDLDEDGVVMQRAWKGLIPNRILIYCLDHEIDPLLFTPSRNHLKFPGPQRKKVKSLSQESRTRVDISKSRNLSSRDYLGNSYGQSAKGIRKLSAGSKQGDLFGSRMVKVPDHEFSRKLKVASNKKSLQKSKSSLSSENEVPLGDRLFETFFGVDAEADESGTGADTYDEHGKDKKVKPIAKRTSDSVTLDEDSMKSILDLMKDASNSITLDEIKQKHKSPSTHASYSKFSDENVTLGKVEGSVQAVRAAVEKLNRGGSLDDAKAVCGKDLLVQMLRWRDKFKVHLSPFLYGMRYTSFGRHFTKVDKLQQIVDMLHWYIEDGDMVVDFCCGSNDFSWLIKTKLDSVGKKCSFKNYDILQAKNDFNFEKRDWMTVRRNELPNGSRLIMGLNPPFGVNAMLANKFINKALEFKPKLVILIVPHETEGLDKKKPPYDLVWEDDHMFVGKSFYLPGSVDKNDKQIEDWNVSAPVLYLWSRQDWTRKHKDIAEQHHHSSGLQNNDIPQDSDMEIDDSPSKEIHSNNEQFMATAATDDVHEDKVTDKRDQTSNVAHQEAKQQATNSIEDDKISAQSHKLKATHQASAPVEGDSIRNQVRSTKVAGSKKFGGKRKRKGHSASNVQQHSAFRREELHSVVGGGSVDKRNPPKPLLSTSQVHPGMRDEHHQLYQRYPPHDVRDESLDDVVRMYLNADELYPSMPIGPAYAPSGVTASSEPWINHPQESASNVRRSYERELNNQLLSAAGPDSWNQMGAHQSYRRPPYVQPGNSNYGELHGPAVQRYAPRLNELGQGPVNQMGPGPHLPQYSMGPYREPAAQPSGLGFASGPPRPFPSNHSSGWLNE